MKILNFGSLNIDYVFHVPEIVKPGETISSSGQALFPGGKGLNQSIALARAGAEVYHAGKVGRDGDFLLNTLKESRVDTDFIEYSEKETGKAIIQVSESGENAIVLNPGANRDIDSAFIQKIFSEAGEVTAVLLQNEISGLGEIIHQAIERNAFIYFNIAPFRDDIFVYPLKKIDLFFANEIEFCQLTGAVSVDSGIKIFRRKFPDSSIVITLGKQGAMMINKSGIEVCSGVDADVVDTTGAGDTFTGYFVAAQSKGLSYTESMDLANKAAALSVTKEGAASSIPSIDEVEDYYA